MLRNNTHIEFQAVDTWQHTSDNLESTRMFVAMLIAKVLKCISIGSHICRSNSYAFI